MLLPLKVFHKILPRLNTIIQEKKNRRFGELINEPSDDIWLINVNSVPTNPMRNNITVGSDGFLTQCCSIQQPRRRVEIIPKRTRCK
jgi:hypothetical protein